MRAFVLATALIVSAAPSLAPATAQETQAKPDAGAQAFDVLFERSHLKNVPPGSTLVYKYLRRSGIDKGPYGPPLEDEIKFTVDAGKNDETRTVRVQMFSGSNRMPAGPFEDYPTNPVIVLFLENHIKGLSPLLEANPRYLKNAIRKGLREKAEVTPTRVDYQGKQVDGWKVVTRPFVGDPQAVRMRGFESLTYTFVTSPDIPGEVVSLEAHATQSDGGELLQERIKYEPDAR